MLEDDADDGLAHLARISAFGREEEAARQLLREGRCALGVVMQVKNVVAHRAQDAQIIDAAVLKESPVLDGDDGMRQTGRNFVVGEHTALGALRALAQAGNEQRLKLVARKRLSVLVADGVDHAVAHVDGGAIGRVIRLRAGPHGDLLRALAERAQQRWLRSTVAAVAGLAQLFCDQLDGELLPRPHLARGGENLRGVGKDRLLEPLVHNACVLDVEKREEANAHQHYAADGCQQAPHNPRPEVMARSGLREPDF